MLFCSGGLVLAFEVGVVYCLLRGLQGKLLLSVYFSGRCLMSAMLFQKTVHVEVIEVVGNSSSVSASAAVIHAKAQENLVHLFLICKIRINASLSLVLVNYFEVPPVYCKYTCYCCW